MMSRGKKKFLFNVFGMAVVCLWLVLIALWVRRSHLDSRKGGIDTGEVTRKVDSSQRDWMEIFLKDKKVGYAVNSIEPFGEGYFIQEEIFLKLNLMGLANGVHTITRCRVDDQFLLASFTFRMTSGVVDFQVSGKVENNEMVIETGRGKDQITQRIKLLGRPMAGAGISYFFKSRKIRVGESFRLPLFDPSTMTQKEAVIRVVAREPITIHRIKYDAFRLETDLWGGAMTFWLDAGGTTLKEEGLMGLTAIKSSGSRASRNIVDQEGTDFYEMTAVGVDRRLPDASRLGYLKLQVHGIDHASLDPAVLNSGRQKFQDGVLEITKERPPFKVSYLLPNTEWAPEMKPFLSPEFNIESNAEEIMRKAREISGDSKNPITVARKMLGWVYRNIEKKPVVSVPSALGVLRTRVGDCNEHATLLTALLRASKIPARLSIGLVYTREKFFYHAWTEAYVGQWISMDATLNQMPVDATHIKLIEGNLDKQVEITPLIGRLRLEVLDYRYD